MNVKPLLLACSLFFTINAMAAKRSTSVVIHNGFDDEIYLVYTADYKEFESKNDKIHLSLYECKTVNLLSATHDDELDSPWDYLKPTNLLEQNKKITDLCDRIAQNDLTYVEYESKMEKLKNNYIDDDTDLNSVLLVMGIGTVDGIILFQAASHTATAGTLQVTSEYSHGSKLPKKDMLRIKELQTASTYLKKSAIIIAATALVVALIDRSVAHIFGSYQASEMNDVDEDGFNVIGNRLDVSIDKVKRSVLKSLFP